MEGTSEWACASKHTIKINGFLVISDVSFMGLLGHL